MTETEKRVRDYLAKIGRRGGIASRRELTRSRAKQIVAIRERKRAALRDGRPWPTAQSQLAHALLIQLEFIDRKPLTMHEILALRELIFGRIERS